MRSIISCRADDRKSLKRETSPIFYFFFPPLLRVAHAQNGSGRSEGSDTDKEVSDKVTLVTIFGCLTSVCLPNSKRQPNNVWLLLGREEETRGGKYYQALIFAVGSFLDCLLKLTVKANWLQNSGQEPENASLCDSGKLILTKEIPVNTAIDWEK